MIEDRLLCLNCGKFTIDIHENDFRQNCAWCNSNKLNNITKVKRRQRDFSMEKRRQHEAKKGLFSPKIFWLPRWIAEV